MCSSVCIYLVRLRHFFHLHVRRYFGMPLVDCGPCTVASVVTVCARAFEGPLSDFELTGCYIFASIINSKCAASFSQSWRPLLKKCFSGLDDPAHGFLALKFTQRIFGCWKRSPCIFSSILCESTTQRGLCGPLVASPVGLCCGNIHCTGRPKTGLNLGCAQVYREKFPRLHDVLSYGFGASEGRSQ
jgi:hypothetical protein